MMAGFYFGASSDYIESVTGGTGSAASIFPVLDRESEINSMSEEGRMPSSRPTGDLKFHRVTFSYPTRPTVNVIKSLLLSWYSIFYEGSRGEPYCEPPFNLSARFP